MHWHLLAASREEGRVEGEVKGEAKGRNEGLLTAIQSMCSAFGIELNAERTQQLTALDANQLKRLVNALAAERKWPDAL